MNRSLHLLLCVSSILAAVSSLKLSPSSSFPRRHGSFALSRRHEQQRRHHEVPSLLPLLSSTARPFFAPSLLSISPSSTSSSSSSSPSSSSSSSLHFRNRREGKRASSSLSSSLCLHRSSASFSSSFSSSSSSSSSSCSIRQIRLSLPLRAAIDSAEDGEALQELFSQQCDADGLMTLDALKKVPDIAEVLESGELLEQELADVWEAAPKFPTSDDRIDVDSFIQVYRDIDDLFEVVDDDGSSEASTTAPATATTTTTATPVPKQVATAPKTDDVVDNDDSKQTGGTMESSEVLKNADDIAAGKGVVAAAASAAGDDNNVDNKSSNDAEDDGVEDANNLEDEQDMESVFESICNSDKLVTKNILIKWDEIQRLLLEGLLGLDEFDELWTKTSKSPGTESLDVEGFLSFNVALDDLFVFDDEEGEEEEEDGDNEEDREIAPPIPEDKNAITDESLPSVGADDAGSVPAKPPPPPGVAAAAAAAAGAGPATMTATTTSTTSATAPTPTAPKRQQPMVSGDDMSPEELFAALAKDNVVGRNEMKRWSELVEWITDGDLLPKEFEAIYKKYANDDDQVDEKGFVALYREVDDLFEDVDDEDEDEEEKKKAKAEEVKKPAGNQIKSMLLALIDSLDPEKLPCGLECNELEKKRIDKVARQLEKDASVNWMQQRGGDIDGFDMAGDWDLIFTTSDIVQFNKGLSTFGRSLPNAKFAGLKQKLVYTKFISDVEYLERIEMKPAVASFDVTITGDWELRKSTNMFTGEPCTVLFVEPDRVDYAWASSDAKYWKSITHMNLLDVSYLDDELRIMRTNPVPDELYIYRRSRESSSS